MQDNIIYFTLSLATEQTTYFYMTLHLLKTDPGYTKTAIYYNVGYYMCGPLQKQADTLSYGTKRPSEAL